MRQIRCAFVDFWDDFLPEKDHQFLFKYYEVIIDLKNPDYVFYSCFGDTHYAYDSCIKIFVSYENIEPNFNECDYAITYSEIQYGDRAFQHTYDEYLQPLPMPSNDELLSRKFCNFIYSNSRLADPFRMLFFEELSKYKKVDSAGPLLNNTGYCVPIGSDHKISFQNQYKFTLAIENSSMPGYTTEKIFHPFMARSLPIYWGNPSVESTYHPDAFVNLMHFSSIPDMVAEIIRLDNDDDAYIRKMTAPFWAYGDSLEDYRERNKTTQCHFYDLIFTLPQDQVRRKTLYGRAPLYRRQQCLLTHPYTYASLLSQVKRTARRLIKF